MAQAADVDKLRSFAAHLQMAREEERSAIAREIHDDLGQALTALRFDLTRMVTKPPTTPTDLDGRVRGMVEMVDAMFRSVRRIATELRPGILDDLGLAAAIEWQAQEFQERTGIACGLSLQEPEMELDPALCTALFRILQEALTNVARHSLATSCQVALAKQPNRLRLVVRDDGRGIRDREIADRRSLGLMGIRERAALWNGSVTIRRAEHSGTVLTVEIPLMAEQMPNAGAALG